jgi:hypothetical protein
MQMNEFKKLTAIIDKLDQVIQSSEISEVRVGLKEIRGLLTEIIGRYEKAFEKRVIVIVVHQDGAKVININCQSTKKDVPDLIADSVVQEFSHCQRDRCVVSVVAVGQKWIPAEIPDLMNKVGAGMSLRGLMQRGSRVDFPNKWDPADLDEQDRVLSERLFLLSAKERNRYFSRERTKDPVVQQRNMDLVNNNPARKIASRLRSRVSSALAGRYKADKTFALIGCSPDFCRQHLESQFIPGMAWENYGRSWHIDHKNPICMFDLSKKDEQREAFHWSNLRPLWKKKNLSRSRRGPIQRTFFHMFA